MLVLQAEKFLIVWVNDVALTVGRFNPQFSPQVTTLSFGVFFIVGKFVRKALNVVFYFLTVVPGVFFDLGVIGRNDLAKDIR